MAQGELPAGAEVILSKFLDRLKRQGYTGDQLVEAGRKWRANFDEDMMKRGGFDELEGVALQPEPELDGLDATLAGLEDQETADELRDILGALDDGFTVAEDTGEVAELDGMAELSRDIDALSPDPGRVIKGRGMGAFESGRQVYRSQYAPDLDLGAGALNAITPRGGPLQLEGYDAPIDEQADLSEEIAALGQDLEIMREPASARATDVPTYRNEEAAARLAAQQQAAPTETITEAIGETPDGGFWDAVSVQDKLGLGLGLAGTALGMAAPMLERDKKFEGQLGQRAAGDTLARREGALAAGQLARGIRGASLGRRDISPALAMRNAQIASARAGSDVMARAAIASAGERQAAQQQLADIRKARVQTQINAGLGALSSTGAWLSSQGAAQKQDARAKQQLGAAQERNRLQAEQNQLYRDSMQGRGKR